MKCIASFPSTSLLYEIKIRRVVTRALLWRPWVAHCPPITRAEESCIYVLYYTQSWHEKGFAVRCRVVTRECQPEWGRRTEGGRAGGRAGRWTITAPGERFDVVHTMTMPDSGKTCADLSVSESGPVWSAAPGSAGFWDQIQVQVWDHFWIGIRNQGMDRNRDRGKWDMGNGNMGGFYATSISISESPSPSIPTSPSDA